VVAVLQGTACGSDVPCVSRKSRGEEGRDQLRVEGLGAALTGGGGRRHGLDEIQRGGRVPAPRNWLNELPGVQGVLGDSVGCSSSKNGAQEKKASRRRRVRWGSSRRVAKWRRGAGHGARLSWGDPGHERRAVGRRQPGDGGVGSRTGEAGEEREGREQGRLASGTAHGVGPACERRKEGGERMASVPGCNSNKIRNNSNLFQLG
jgi:hypothetical protein